MPPPLLVAELPEMVESETVRAPEFQMPPPKDAELPEMMELSTVRLPELSKAPPLAEEAFAPDTVTPEMVKSPPASTAKILKLPWLPSMVSEEAPAPVMVSEPAPKVAAMAGKADPREIVLLTPPRKTDESKTISSFALVALASIIANLNEPVPESLVVVTVKIAISPKQASSIIHPFTTAFGN